MVNDERLLQITDIVNDVRRENSMYINEREEMKKHCYCKRCGNEIKRNPENRLMTLYRVHNYKLNGKESREDIVGERHGSWEDARYDYSKGFYLCTRCAKEFQLFMELGNPKDEVQLIELLRKENEALRSEKLNKIEEVLNILQDVKNYYEEVRKNVYGNILGYESGYDFF